MNKNTKVIVTHSSTFEYKKPIFIDFIDIFSISLLNKFEIQ